MYRRKKKSKHQSGMTLIEIMFAFAIFTVVMGALYTLSFSFGDVAELQQATATNMDNCRSTMQGVSRELRQAIRTSINFAELPGTSITYRIPEDLDGNGSGVDMYGKVEAGPERTITLDMDDLNGDGFKETQLVLIINGVVDEVIANNLNDELETAAADGVFGPANDTDGDGNLDRGFWIEVQGRGLLVEVQGKHTSRRGRDIVNALSEFVIPRN